MIRMFILASGPFWTLWSLKKFSLSGPGRHYSFCFTYVFLFSICCIHPLFHRSVFSSGTNNVGHWIAVLYWLFLFEMSNEFNMMLKVTTNEWKWFAFCAPFNCQYFYKSCYFFFNFIAFYFKMRSTGCERRKGFHVKFFIFKIKRARSVVKMNILHFIVCCLHHLLLDASSYGILCAIHLHNICKKWCHLLTNHALNQLLRHLQRSITKRLICCWGTRFDT